MLAAPGMEKPPIFQPMGYEEALHKSSGERTWLLVDATAAWCPPCKQMDKTTWRDPAVAAWLAGRGLAIQVDVDADEPLARRLEIRAMPTVIAYKDGVERDRVTGFMNGAGLVAWLEGLERGETAVDQLRRSVVDPERDMGGRLDVAQALLRARRFDEATDEMVWLWNNIARVEPGMEGVRVSFMAGDIEELVGQHEPARTRFAEIRERTGALADAGASGSAQARFDWMVLNEILADTERTVDWFDTVKGNPRYAALLEQMAHRLIPLLTERHRLADIGRLYADPVAHLVRSHQMTKPPQSLTAATGGAPSEMLDKIQGLLARRFREDSVLLVAALRAAGRVSEGAAVEREALRLDGSAEMQAAMRNGRATTN
jgi:hypothetical protein